ncbi:hypothetical protein D3C71_649450 [compost metagenome]
MQTKEINDSDFEIITSHFKRLDLLKKYKEKCNTELSTKIKSLSRSQKAGVSLENLSITLFQHIVALKEDNGANYWQTSMYEALYNNLEEVLKLY